MNLKRIIREEIDNQVDKELSSIMPLWAPIPKTKQGAANVIKKIFNSSKQTHYKVGDNIDLTKLKNLKDKVRFFEYGKSFQSEKEGRGFNFEGMLAGLFNGDVVVGKDKEDIIVGEIPYSVKTSEPGSSFDSGTLKSGFKNVTDFMKDGGLDVSDMKKPIDLLRKGEEYNLYKREMLESSFVDKSNEPLEWIFAIIYPDNIIKYSVWSSKDLIDAIINEGEKVFGEGRSSVQIRLKSRYLMTNPKTITFPTIESKDLEKILYNKERGHRIDKVAELFGKYKTKIRPDVLKYIKDNPNSFIRRVINLYPEKVQKILNDRVNHQ